MAVNPNLRNALITLSQLTANEKDHRRMRRLQSHMFSEKALIAQEPLIASYVNKLVSRLHEQARKPETAAVDLVKWYNYTTFDVCSKTYS